MAQTAQHLPGTVNVIHAPAPVPRAVVILGIDQVADRVADRTLFRVEVNVTEKLESARGEIAAGRIKDGVVIGERHVLEPAIHYILIECGPAAVATLEAKLPGKGPSK